MSFFESIENLVSDWTYPSLGATWGFYRDCGWMGFHGPWEDDVHLTRAAEMMDVHPPKSVIYPLVKKNSLLLKTAHL